MISKTVDACKNDSTISFGKAIFVKAYPKWILQITF